MATLEMSGRAQR